MSATVSSFRLFISRLIGLVLELAVATLVVTSTPGEPSSQTMVPSMRWLLTTSTLAPVLGMGMDSAALS